MKENIRFRSVIAVGVYAAVLGICIATLFFPQTGNLSIIREAGIALLLLSTAVLVGYAAFFWIKPTALIVPIAVCAITMACFGVVRTTHVVKDLGAGPQIVELASCKLRPDCNVDSVVVTGDYSLVGTDVDGKTYEFPLTAKEYRALARQMEDPADTWKVKAIAYTHCQRVVTFTAEKVATQNGGGENGC